ncbi:MAG: hypothetical protein US60_C0031G0013 [Microgenomates group bacterium GW2011_GWC1_37_8]|nr:MAG: hypothetical protein US60_C0031G0013 [Microgenomates group bacterium GW2011_GWC1_37_8]
MDNINRLPSEPKTENNQVSLTPKVNEQSVNAQESSKYVNSNVVASGKFRCYKYTYSRIEHIFFIDWCSSLST